MENGFWSALSDPSRRRILEILRQGNLPAGEIGKEFSMRASSVSHHLSVLKAAGLVSGSRQGQEIIYSLNLSVFEELAQFLATFLQAKRKKG
jgi:ArsR family transcriptional regulator, arsenate/arsenite/antimonite-responsive transcriptional repressor